MYYILYSMNPTAVDASPPSHAVRMYKIIALLDGVPTSVFDGTTQYHPFVTMHQDAQPEHQGGLYVYPTIEDCLKTERRHFPATSRLASAPRAIAVVLAWNDSNVALPVIYGAKRAYSYVQLVDLLPMPPTYGLTPHHGGTARPSSARSSPPGNLARAQARTMLLELEVQGMERRLELARRVLGPSNPLGG